MVEEVIAYIAANISQWIPADGVSVNGNLTKDFRPNDPDMMCTVYQFPGAPPQRGMGNTIQWYNPRLQIVNRRSVADGFPAAKLDARNIKNLLEAVTNRSLSGTFYMAIRADGEPSAQAIDPSSRPVYVTDYSVMKYAS